MKLEDMCLTIEQARELKELGVDFSDACFAFLVVRNHSSLCRNDSTDDRLVPTLTNTEMLEMLPKDDSVQIYCCKTWDIVYFDYETRKNHESIFPLLRDALFDMVKWLKTNKII